MAKQVGTILVEMAYEGPAVSYGTCEYDRCWADGHSLYKHENGQSPFLYRACCPVHAQLAWEQDHRE